MSNLIFNDDLLTVQSAAEILGIKERTLKEKANNGEVSYRKLGQKMYFMKSDLVTSMTFHGKKQEADGTIGQD